uniref:Signal transducer and activator of transcription linker domain-containing protein n=1 Tax=Megaselia scalaris TaxID=36166 RepID=T1H3R2_MEGSC
MSQPIVVNVHVIQEPESWGSIIWRHALSNENDLNVTWSTLSRALNKKCISITKRSLSDSDIDFLYFKLFPEDKNVDFRKHIPRLDFLGDPVNSKISSPSNQSSFWGWFYSGMKLLSYEPVNNHWMNERIYGFLSKSETE